MDNVFKEIWADKFVRTWLKIIVFSFIGGIFGTILAQIVT